MCVSTVLFEILLAIPFNSFDQHSVRLTSVCVDLCFRLPFYFFSLLFILSKWISAERLTRTKTIKTFFRLEFAPNNNPATVNVYSAISV